MSNLDSTKAAIVAAKTRMEKAVDDFRKELTSVRTGRANAAILENVRVDYHGTPMPVNQLGNLTVPDASMLMITPWDPSVVPLIDKAIRASDLGLNPPVGWVVTWSDGIALARPGAWDGPVLSRRDGTRSREDCRRPN